VFFNSSGLVCDRCGAVIFRRADTSDDAEGIVEPMQAVMSHRAECPEQRPGMACPHCHTFVAFGEAGGAASEDDMLRGIAEHTAVCSRSPLLATGAELAKLHDDQLHERLWERVLMLSEREMTPEQRAFYHSELLNMEVDNGGLVQYFLNTRGEEIDETRAALATIGAHYHAALFEQAVTIWNEERLKPGSCWQRDLDDRAFSESRISELDDDWYGENLLGVELAYARANTASI
jgi:hypothetical protein